MLQDDRAGRKCRQPSSELCSELPDRTGEEQERVPGRGLSRAAGSAGFAGGSEQGLRSGPCQYTLELRAWWSSVTRHVEGV